MKSPLRIEGNKLMKRVGSSLIKNLIIDPIKTLMYMLALMGWVIGFVVIATIPIALFYGVWVLFTESHWIQAIFLLLFAVPFALLSYTS